ncbi:MAG: TldD/PmbA family protein [Deltaproteobacteria bacterium]|nr:TldD/PmbA family protein [Deltaproteobacteria bacterium]
MKAEAFAKKVLERATKLGADQAEVYLETSRQSSVRVHEGEIQDLTQATSKGLGLRVICGGRLGFACTSDFEGDADDFVKRAVALAQVAAPDENNVLPSASDLQPRVTADLQLFDPRVAELDEGWKIKVSLEMEKAARAADPRVSKFDSCGAGDAVSEAYIASSAGLEDRARGTYVYLYASPVASQDGQLQVGSWSDSKRFLADLESPEQVGKTAALRATRMLGAKKAKTAKVPVIFDPQIAASFVGSLAGAVNGDMIFKKASFLLNKLGERIAPAGFTVVDDGLLPRGLGTGPWDGEGVPLRKTAIVEGGVLKSYLYDVHTAHKAKARTTGNASRGYSSLPHIGVNNFYLEKGNRKPEDLIREVKNGLYVTFMLGRGANTITGDYSRGANGIWIENGELAFPVQECTVAGNLLQMFQAIDGIGDDLVFRGGVNAPTLRFSELTVAGS